MPYENQFIGGNGSRLVRGLRTEAYQRFRSANAPLPGLLKVSSLYPVKDVVRHHDLLYSGYKTNNTVDDSTEYGRRAWRFTLN